MESQRNTTVLIALLATFFTFSAYTIVSAQEETYQTIIHDGYNFSVSSIPLPWAEAVNACEAIGQKLLSVESPEKDNVLVELFVEQKHGNYSLDGKDRIWTSATELREGVWYHASLNKPCYYSRWFMNGEPDDTQNLNCVYLATGSLMYWRDANCSATVMYYICESRVSETVLGGYD